LPPALALAVPQHRRDIAAALGRTSLRLVVVVGPCSIHEPRAALEYAARLAALQAEVGDALLLVMRTYFEKPRSTIGWKGLLNDPHLDRSFSVAAGLSMCRQLLCDIGALGVPTACEFLDPVSPRYLADAVCWGAIGARTAESQVHRELASGLEMPIGFKNGTDGRVDVAVQGVVAAAQPHRFLGINPAGQAAVISTRGNADCHIILRGGKSGPNYAPEAVAAALEQLRAAGLPPRVMVDVSHGNSNKQLDAQLEVSAAVARQVAAGNRGIVGLMMESFLVGGSQAFGELKTLRYGQSITDSCLGWEQTVQSLGELAAAVRRRG
jgi:3-deoxy-7-phosphoheptulonate synthase